MGNSEPSQRPYVDRNDVNKIPEVPVSSTSRSTQIRTESPPTFSVPSALDYSLPYCSLSASRSLKSVSPSIYSENLRKMTYPLDG